jgi:ubiquitin carboxyl-terminal hydrolase 34
LEITATLWPIVARLIPAAASNRQQCEETFSLALTLLKRLSDTSLNIDPNTIIRQWGSLLAAHETVEEVGQPDSVDMVAQGLTNLLYYAVSIANASDQALSAGDLGPQLFQKHLFPELSDEPHRDNEIVAPRIPLLNTMTRHSMCETIFNLIKDDGTRYKDVLQLLHNIVPYDPTYENPYAWDLTAGYERSKAIRSSTGYVGLRNLSNTCYLNSLVTQLFMNVSFREFIFQAHVADGGSQKLLSETQLLFAYMQNSVRRYVDPTNFANTIRTFDDAQIDVTVQMDVDEFYNLLFDRWERQILAPDAKRKFRSFYGGQLVQQVKSKECPHISERMEEFSAIQCDIKGKSSLQESLQAYVDGEVMEGDNKYKCSTCDRHVDAVKRACLKDIPDNLIFHLKRFDFNLRTLQRSKINDYFNFPSKIDMRPYKVEHLMDDDSGAGEDMFELVGVLVHSGTAESGHYYSFIRERPSTAETPSWVEYNDDSVTPWDVNSMEANCFGGVDARGTMDASNMQYEKNYSAYMLFYQRSSELEASQQALRQSNAASPVNLPVLPQHSVHLAMENELLMRKYCLYDPSHPGFVMKMIHNMKRINGGTCSESHDLEKQAMHVALSHLDQVVARTKDIPDAPNFITTLRQQCQACAECSRDFLEYFCECTDSLRFLLMKCPEVYIRTEIATSIVGALVKVRSDAPYAYGLEKSGDDDSIIDVECPKVLQRVVMALNQLYEVFHTCLKAWPEYFGLLSSIANLGDNEAAVLLDAGFLIKAMDIITADPVLNIGPQLTRMLALVSKRSATRPVSYDCVIGLLYKLLHAGAMTNNDAIEENESRLALSLEGLELALTIPERDRLLQRWTRTNSHILTEKLLLINQNQYATRMIIMILLHYSSNIDGNIFSAILHGIRRNTSTLSGPFLRAALVYCEHSEAERAIPNMVANVAKSAGHVENAEGREYLRFFKDFINLPSNYHDVEHDNIIRFCLNSIPAWAPTLLTYYESTVRADTEDFLNELIFSHGTDFDSSNSPSSSPEEDLVTAVAQRLANSCLEYVHEIYIRQRQQAVRTVLINIQNTIEQCVPFFGSDDNNPQKAQFRDRMDGKFLWHVHPRKHSLIIF